MEIIRVYYINDGGTQIGAFSSPCVPMERSSRFNFQGYQPDVPMGRVQRYNRPIGTSGW